MKPARRNMVIVDEWDYHADFPFRELIELCGHKPILFLPWNSTGPTISGCGHVCRNAYTRCCICAAKQTRDKPCDICKRRKNGLFK